MMIKTAKHTPTGTPIKIKNGNTTRNGVFLRPALDKWGDEHRAIILNENDRSEAVYLSDIM